MFNLIDIMRAAQGGQAVDNIARQFGISPEQGRLAVAALLPAFAMGMQRNAAQPDAFAQLLQMMSTERYKPFFEDPTAAFTPQARTSGQDVLGKMFGSPELSRRVAEQAGTMSGVAGETMAQLMPVLAATLMGGMAQAASAQGLAPAFQRYSEMMRAGAFPPAPPPPPPPPSPAANPWQEMMGAMLGAAAPAASGGAAPSEPRAAGSGSDAAANPWEEMFSTMMGVGKPAPEEAPAPEAEPGDGASADPERPAAGGEAFAAYEQMVRSSREMHDAHVAALKALFESFWGKR